MRTALEAHLCGEDYIDVKIGKGRELIKEKKEAEAESLLTEAISVLEKAIQLGLGHQARFAETLRKNWMSER